MEENGFKDIEIIKDLAGLDRVCVGIKGQRDLLKRKDIYYV